MEAFRPLRLVLCVYECMRLAFLAGAYRLLQPEGTAAFPWLALITPGAMFLLMALFWMLDISLYRVFCPLYMAGKGLGIITTLFWLFFTKSYMISELYFHGIEELAVLGLTMFLLLGDMLSVWLVNRMRRG